MCLGYKTMITPYEENKKKNYEAQFSINWMSKGYIESKIKWQNQWLELSHVNLSNPSEETGITS